MKVIKKMDWGYEVHDPNMKGNTQVSAAVGIYPLSVNLTETQKEELDKNGEIDVQEES